MEFGKSSWSTFEKGIEKEWLVTNGIGGFASSTVICANTRRYHGLLVASLNPPVARHLVLSKIDESVITGHGTYNLYSAKTPDTILNGYLHLQKVLLDPLPVFVYNISDIFIEKKVCMVHGKNTVVVVYRIINGESGAKLRLTPLVNFRDYHFNSSRQYMKFKSKQFPDFIAVNPYDLDIDIKIYCSDGEFVAQDDSWFYNMDYPIERERGLHSTEDHYIPGYFEVDIQPHQEKTVTVIATVENEIGETDGPALVEEEEKRIRRVVDKAGFSDEFAQRLVASADNFIVYRKSTGKKTIIAGYPWFTDWGRDTMIAFTGLTLATKRFDDAKEILYTFSKYVKYGLVPNMFPDTGQEPAYNTVDASLWYFEAVSKYIEYTGDYEFIKDNIFPGLKEIIKNYMDGTRFNIRMGKDCLVSAGDIGTQLTWMDAKVGDWVVTPRHGKAVEINALWFNALKTMSILADKFDGDVSFYLNTAQNVKSSFEREFWNEEKQCLYDVIGADFKDDSVRPNQVMAVSLTNAVIDGEKAKKIVQKVMKHLYTAYGLRSLLPESDKYTGIYSGDQFKRDSAYHQGTVWAWLMGPFITAYLKAYGHTAPNRDIAARLIESFRDHLNDSCVGSISEIFDGNDPHTPRGCFAQAWSVGEILRAYVEDIKGIGK